MASNSRGGFLYRSYNFVTKDPIIEAARAVRRASKDDKQAHQISGVHTQTIHGWFDGDTRNPRHSTITAYAAAYGFVRQDRLNRDGTVDVHFVQVRDMNIERELEKQADWILRREQAKERAELRAKAQRKAKRNGHANGHASAHL